MAKTKTTTSSKTPTTKKTTSRKSKKQVKEETPVVSEPVQEPVESTETVEEKTTEEVDDDQMWRESFSTMETNLKQMVTLARETEKVRKSAFSYLNKRVKTLKKRKNKRGGGNQKKNPSGFNKPAHISKELSSFLNVEDDCLMPRTEATKQIHAYIKEHNLQNPKDGRQINCDKTLQTLLKVPKDVTLSYFNLQTYLSPHFVKA